MADPVKGPQLPVRNEPLDALRAERGLPTTALSLPSQQSAEPVPIDIGTWMMNGKDPQVMFDADPRQIDWKPLPKDQYKQKYGDKFRTEQEFNDWYTGVAELYTNYAQTPWHSSSTRYHFNPQNAIGVLQRSVPATKNFNWETGAKRYAMTKSTIYGEQAIQSVEGTALHANDGNFLNKYGELEKWGDKTRFRRMWEGNYAIDYNKQGMPFIRQIEAGIEENTEAMDVLSLWGTQQLYSQSILAPVFGFISGATVEFAKALTTVSVAGGEMINGGPEEGFKPVSWLDVQLAKLTYKPAEFVKQAGFFGGDGAWAYNIGNGIGMLVPQRAIAKTAAKLAAKSMVKKALSREAARTGKLFEKGVSRDILKGISKNDIDEIVKAATDNGVFLEKAGAIQIMQAQKTAARIGSMGAGTTQALAGVWEEGKRNGIDGDELAAIMIPAAFAVAATEWMIGSKWITAGIGLDKTTGLSRMLNKDISESVVKTAKNFLREQKRHGYKDTDGILNRIIGKKVATAYVNVDKAIKGIGDAAQDMRGNKVGQILYGVGKGALAEGSQEAMEESVYMSLEMLGDFAARKGIFGDPSAKKIGDGFYGTNIFSEEGRKRLAENFLAGAVLGGIMDGAVIRSGRNDAIDMHVVTNMIQQGIDNGTGIYEGPSYKKGIVKEAYELWKKDKDGLGNLGIDGNILESKKSALTGEVQREEPSPDAVVEKLIINRNGELDAFGFDKDYEISNMNDLRYYAFALKTLYWQDVLNSVNSTNPQIVALYTKEGVVMNDLMTASKNLREARTAIETAQSAYKQMSEQEGVNEDDLKTAERAVATTKAEYDEAFSEFGYWVNPVNNKGHSQGLIDQIRDDYMTRRLVTEDGKGNHIYSKELHDELVGKTKKRYEGILAKVDEAIKEENNKAVPDNARIASLSTRRDNLLKTISEHGKKRAFFDALADVLNYRKDFVATQREKLKSKPEVLQMFEQNMTAFQDAKAKGNVKEGLKLWDSIMGIVLANKGIIVGAESSAFDEEFDQVMFDLAMGQVNFADEGFGSQYMLMNKDQLDTIAKRLKAIVKKSKQYAEKDPNAFNPYAEAEKASTGLLEQIEALYDGSSSVVAQAFQDKTNEITRTLLKMQINFKAALDEFNSIYNKLKIEGGTPGADYAIEKADAADMMVDVNEDASRVSNEFAAFIKLHNDYVEKEELDNYIFDENKTYRTALMSSGIAGDYEGDRSIAGLHKLVLDVFNAIRNNQEISPSMVKALSSAEAAIDNLIGILAINKNLQLFSQGHPETGPLNPQGDFSVRGKEFADLRFREMSEDGQTVSVFGHDIPIEQIDAMIDELRELKTGFRYNQQALANSYGNEYTNPAINDETPVPGIAQLMQMSKSNSANLQVIDMKARRKALWSDTPFLFHVVKELMTHFEESFTPEVGAMADRLRDSIYDQATGRNILDPNYVNDSEIEQIEKDVITLKTKLHQIITMKEGLDIRIRKEYIGSGILRDMLINKANEGGKTFIYDNYPDESVTYRVDPSSLNELNFWDIDTGLIEITTKMKISVNFAKEHFNKRMLDALGDVMTYDASEARMLIKEVVDEAKITGETDDGSGIIVPSSQQQDVLERAVGNIISDISFVGNRRPLESGSGTTRVVEWEGGKLRNKWVGGFLINGSAGSGKTTTLGFAMRALALYYKKQDVKPTVVVVYHNDEHRRLIMEHLKSSNTQFNYIYVSSNEIAFKIGVLGSNVNKADLLIYDEFSRMESDVALAISKNFKGKIIGTGDSKQSLAGTQPIHEDYAAFYLAPRSEIMTANFRTTNIEANLFLAEIYNKTREFGMDGSMPYTLINTKFDAESKEGIQQMDSVEDVINAFIEDKRADSVIIFGTRAERDNALAGPLSTITGFNPKRAIFVTGHSDTTISSCQGQEYSHVYVAIEQPSEQGTIEARRNYLTAATRFQKYLCIHTSQGKNNSTSVAKEDIPKTKDDPDSKKNLKKTLLERIRTLGGLFSGAIGFKSRKKPPPTEPPQTPSQPTPKPPAGPAPTSSKPSGEKSTTETQEEIQTSPPSDTLSEQSQESTSPDNAKSSANESNSKKARRKTKEQREKEKTEALKHVGFIGLMQDIKDAEKNSGVKILVKKLTGYEIDEINKNGFNVPYTHRDASGPVLTNIRIRINKGDTWVFESYIPADVKNIYLLSNGNYLVEFDDGAYKTLMTTDYSGKPHKVVDNAVPESISGGMTWMTPVTFQKNSDPDQIWQIDQTVINHIETTGNEQGDYFAKAAALYSSSGQADNAITIPMSFGVSFEPFGDTPIEDEAFRQNRVKQIDDAVKSNKKIHLRAHWNLSVYSGNKKTTYPEVVITAGYENDDGIYTPLAVMYRPRKDMDMMPTESGDFSSEQSFNAYLTSLYSSVEELRPKIPSYDPRIGTEIGVQIKLNAESVQKMMKVDYHNPIPLASILKRGFGITSITGVRVNFVQGTGNQGSPLRDVNKVYQVVTVKESIGNDVEHMIVINSRKITESEIATKMLENELEAFEKSYPSGKKFTSQQYRDRLIDFNSDYQASFSKSFINLNRGLIMSNANNPAIKGSFQTYKGVVQPASGDGTRDKFETQVNNMKRLVDFLRSNGGYVPISDYTGKINPVLVDDAVSYAVQIRYPTLFASDITEYRAQMKPNGLALAIDKDVSSSENKDRNIDCIGID